MEVLEDKWVKGFVLQLRRSPNRSEQTESLEILLHKMSSKQSAGSSRDTFSTKQRSVLLPPRLHRLLQSINKHVWAGATRLQELHQHFVTGCNFMWRICAKMTSSRLMFCLTDSGTDELQSFKTTSPNLPGRLTAPTGESVHLTRNQTARWQKLYSDQLMGKARNTDCNWRRTGNLLQTNSVKVD